MDAMHAEFEVEGGSVLDIGGGSGYLRRYLKPGQRYVDLEPDPDAYARRALFKPLDSKLTEPFLFLRGVGEYVPFCEHSFDAVYMGGMIEHLFDINFAFSEAYRVLKEGGHLYIFAGCRGFAVKSTGRSAPSKLISYVRDNGISAAIRRMWEKALWDAKQKFSPWKGLMDFTHAQVEAGHIYDDLFKKDVIELAERYGLSLAKSMDVASSGDTVFIFTKLSRISGVGFPATDRVSR
jgi:SAM-dependent methyltransferase